MNDDQVIDGVTAKLLGELKLFDERVVIPCKEGGQFLATTDITPAGLNPFEHYEIESVYLPIYKTGLVVGIYYIDDRPVWLEIEGLE